MRNLIAAPLIALATLAPVVPAHAEDVPPPPAAAEPATAAARARDASIDRGLFTTHAETIGEGRWAFNAYELIFVGLTYGFTDDIQASFSTLLPITSDIPLTLALQPKFVLMRTDDTVVSLRTPLAFASSDGTEVFTFGAGVLIDQRLDARGRFALHGGFAVFGVAGDLDLDDDVSLADGAALQLDLGVTLGLTAAVKIIIEGQLFGVITDAGFEISDAALINYGVRFHNGDLAGDIGFIRPVGVDTGDLILGVPYLAFSARF